MPQATCHGGSQFGAHVCKCPAEPACSRTESTCYPGAEHLRVDGLLCRISFPHLPALTVSTHIWKPLLSPCPAHRNHTVRLTCPQLKCFRPAQVTAKRRVRFLCYHLSIQLFLSLQRVWSVSGRQHSIKCESYMTLRCWGDTVTDIFWPHHITCLPPLKNPLSLTGPSAPSLYHTD